MKLHEIATVNEGWKDKVAAGVLSAAVAGGAGYGIANSPMAYVKGQQIQMALKSTEIPTDAKLVTDDEGKKIYMWQPKELKSRGLKGTPWVYSLAKD